MSAEEIEDLFLLSQLVGNVVEKRYGRNALTLSIQDGADAGQTVDHVHVHVLPRSPTDFARNDDVYEKIDKTDLGKAHLDCDERRQVV